MKPLVGFVLVTHSAPEQTLFLCERLNAMFGEPPISIHHDFSRSLLYKTVFPRNVRFVESWTRTSWGDISLVDAVLLAIRQLYKQDDPEWVVSLSGADYPIQTAEYILNQLATTDYDAFLDSRRIEDTGLPFLGTLGALSYNHPQYPQTAFNRYMATPLLSVRVKRRLGLTVEKWCLRSQFLSKKLTPFDGTIGCFAGDAWFTANRRVAKLFTDETPLWRTLHDHYRSRQAADESFYHTLLGNTPGFKVCSDNLRYTDWTGCCAHPRTLGEEDFPRLLASNAHFARKFILQPALISALNTALTSKSN